MGKSAGKPGEMRYTGISTDKKGAPRGETFRDSKDREWEQRTGAGTPTMTDRSAYNSDTSAVNKKGNRYAK